MQKRDPDLLYALALSLLFVVMDGAVFALAAEPVGRMLMVSPPLGDLLHALIVFGMGTLLGCLGFCAVGQKKHLIPWGFSFFALYLLICGGLVSWGLPAEDQPAAWELLMYCGAVPTVEGMAVSWGIYGLWKRKQTVSGR